MNAMSKRAYAFSGAEQRAYPLCSDISRPQSAPALNAEKRPLLVRIPGLENISFPPSAWNLPSDQTEWGDAPHSL